MKLTEIVTPDRVGLLPPGSSPSKRQVLEHIADLLVRQVTGRVRWRESVQWLATDGGVTTFAELGAGKVLTGMSKRIAPEANSVALNSAADFEAFAASLKA